MKVRGRVGRPLKTVKRPSASTSGKRPRRERSQRPFGDATGEIGTEYLVAVRRIGPQTCRVDGVLRAVGRDRPGTETDRALRSRIRRIRTRGQSTEPVIHAIRELSGSKWAEAVRIVGAGGADGVGVSSGESSEHAETRTVRRRVNKAARPFALSLSKGSSWSVAPPLCISPPARESDRHLRSW